MATNVMAADSTVDYIIPIATDDIEAAKRNFTTKESWRPLFQVLQRPNVALVWQTNGFYDLCSHKRLMDSEWFVRRSTAYKCASLVFRVKQFLRV